MKKQLCLFLIGALYANWDITAQILSIDDTKKTITIGGWNAQTMEIQILPHTRLEGDDCGWFGMWDTSGTFKDLEVGQIVEIDLLQTERTTANTLTPESQQIPAARKIEWQCGRRAY